jgi:hypothetical protein
VTFLTPEPSEKSVGVLLNRRAGLSVDLDSDEANVRIGFDLAGWCLALAAQRRLRKFVRIPLKRCVEAPKFSCWLQATHPD